MLRLLNKKDLADKARLDLWLEHWRGNESILAHPFSTLDKADVAKISQWVGVRWFLIEVALKNRLEP